MPTVALKVRVPESYQEILIAELAELDFESFEQESRHVIAYAPSSRWDDVKRERVATWLATRGLDTTVEERVIADENWNRRWEESIEPIVVGPFLVKPSWSEIPAEHRDLTLLEINPKMSFGTGHHESTRLMLGLLPGHLSSGDRVLDAGTGTGILAVAAAKLGAESVVAVDDDVWSQQNAAENFHLNRVDDRITLVPGRVEEVAESGFDVILANLDLHAIRELMSFFVGRLRPGGVLLAAGLLVDDRKRLLPLATGSGLDLREERVDNEWWAGVFQHAGTNP
jgi:ribosomal protein L11 methyltransferase